MTAIIGTACVIFGVLAKLIHLVWLIPLCIISYLVQISLSKKGYSRSIKGNRFQVNKSSLGEIYTSLDEKQARAKQNEIGDIQLSFLDNTAVLKKRINLAEEIKNGILDVDYEVTNKKDTLGLTLHAKRDCLTIKKAPSLDRALLLNNFLLLS